MDNTCFDPFVHPFSPIKYSLFVDRNYFGSLAIALMASLFCKELTFVCFDIYFSKWKCCSFLLFSHMLTLWRELLNFIINYEFYL